jgi:hypothetical protein
MSQNIQMLVPLFNQFNGRKVGHGHFGLDVAPSQRDKDGNDHVCLRIGSVGSSVNHPMRRYIGKLVFSAECLVNSKLQLWQYFRNQQPCEPFSVGQYSTIEQLKDALENAISLS